MVVSLRRVATADRVVACSSSVYPSVDRPVLHDLAESITEFHVLHGALLLRRDSRDAVATEC